MDFAGPAHVYWVAPPTNGNLTAKQIEQARKQISAEKDKRKRTALEKELKAIESQQVLIGLRCFTMPEMDAEHLAVSAICLEHAQTKWKELQTKRTYEEIGKKFVGVKNLTVGGVPVETWDDFYRLAPKDMVAWVCMAVYSSDALSEAEAKNFSPASASAAT